MKVYSIDFFKSIKKSSNNNLPIDILQTINELSELVSAPEYNKTPDFVDKYKKKTKKIDNNNEIIPFNRTIIIKKEGIKKDIDLIRALLNKLTENHYRNIADNIKNNIEILSKNYSNDDCKYFGDCFINLLINNIIYSKLYANLIKELQEYNFIVNSLQESIDKFLENYKKDKELYYKNNLSFDEVSEINKKIDRNKGFANLFVNLLIIEYLDYKIIINFINELINLFFELTSLPSKNIQVDEVSEILYILIKYSHKLIKNNNEWEDIENNIIYISNMKSNSRPSISNKNIFKFMDIKDEINL